MKRTEESRELIIDNCFSLLRMIMKCLIGGIASFLSENSGWGVEELCGLLPGRSCSQSHFERIYLHSTADIISSSSDPELFNILGFINIHSTAGCSACLSRTWHIGIKTAQNTANEMLFSDQSNEIIHSLPVRCLFIDLTEKCWDLHLYYKNN